MALRPAAARASPSFVSSLQGPAQDMIAPGHWLGQFFGLNSRSETWTFERNSPAEVGSGSNIDHLWITDDECALPLTLKDGTDHHPPTTRIIVHVVFEVSAALVAVLNELTPERREKLLMPEFGVTRADAAVVHVRTWTKAEWLDVLDVRLEAPRSGGGGSSGGSGGGSGGGCVATASFYATGFLPTSIPLSPVANVAMAWLPFASPGPRGEMLQEFRLRAIKGLVAKKLQETYSPRIMEIAA